MIPQIAGAVFAGLVLVVYRQYVHIAPVFFLAGGLVLSYSATLLTLTLTTDGRLILGHVWDAVARVLKHIKTRGK